MSIASIDFYGNTIINANNFGEAVGGDVVKINNNTFKNVKSIFGVPKSEILNSKNQLKSPNIIPKKFEFLNNKLQ